MLRRSLFSGRRVSSPSESAWIWLTVFALAATIGVLAIGPKYAQRKAGIDRRAAGRETAWRNQNAHNTLPAAETGGSARGIAWLVAAAGAGALTLGALAWLVLRGQHASSRSRAPKNHHGIP